MIYTLPMSTADRYMHQRLPVLRDLTDTLKRQRERQSWSWGRDGQREEKRSKLMMEFGMAWETTNVTGVKESEGVIRAADGDVQGEAADEGDNRGNEVAH